MNRSFPGKKGGSPTAAIADFVSSVLLPLADAGLDLHSGGASACFLPSAFLCTSDDRVMMRRNLELIDAFNAPLTYVVDGGVNPAGFDGVAHRANVPFISTELYGGANVDPGATAIGWRGVHNVMCSLGLLDAMPSQLQPTRFLNGMGGSGYLNAPYSGIFEPACQLGDTVDRGDVAGWLYATEEVEREPLELLFDRSGTIFARHHGARVIRGSHLFLVAGELPRDELLARV
jgi:predicted deacylase